MSKAEEVVIEKAAESKEQPWMKNLEKDHPELSFEKPAVKDEKKSAFEKNLNKIVDEPVKEEKEESKQAEQPAETADQPAEEQPSKEEAQPEEAEEDKGEVAAAGDDARIKAYAEKNGITEEKAKEEINEYRSIAKKYKDDPIELAKAYKNMQSAFDKQKASETQNQQARMVSNIMADPQAFISKAEKEHAPKWIEQYRKEFPAKSELMTDAAILEECRQVALDKVSKQIGDYQNQLKREADTKREEFLKALKESERPFATEISRVLKGLPDIQVVGKDFNFVDLVRWAKGDERNIQKLIKEAEERGFKRAQSGEILGEKFVAKGPSSSAKPKPKEVRAAGEQLSGYEKRQALEMFPATSGSEEERYQSYIDVVKKRNKK